MGNSHLRRRRQYDDDSAAEQSVDVAAGLVLLDLSRSDVALSPELLERLYVDCARWLADPELGFEPLLPSETSPVGIRTDALVDWCRGFLGGIGLAGAGQAGALSSEASEILSDFGTIAATRFEYADAEEDENALAEVIEFIRMGALLLHAELHAERRAGRTLH